MAVVRLVLDGRLARVGRNPAERFFLSVLVDAREVGPHVVGRAYEGFSARDVERLIPARFYTLKRLIEKGRLATETAKNPSNPVETTGRGDAGMLSSSRRVGP